jgi:O-acetyl-ADP-ribose deacetylase (regulator of RNase III)
MIRYKQGNLFESNTDALVNAVNTVGIMGKGIALMFKQAFPDNFTQYEAACKAGKVKVGHVFAVERYEMFGPKWIINFPTKQHWRHPSKIEWVTEGLKALRAFIAEREIKSIAIPPLGCGLGGLDWQEVRREIESALSGIEGVDIIVYEPTAKY